MRPTQIFQEFEKLAEQLNIRLVTGKGNFNGDYCLVEQDKYIVLNKNRPIEQRLRRLAMAFAQMDLSNIYIKPALRDLIENERVNVITESAEPLDSGGE